MSESLPKENDQELTVFGCSVRAELPAVSCKIFRSNSDRVLPLELRVAWVVVLGDTVEVAGLLAEDDNRFNSQDGYVVAEEPAGRMVLNCFLDMPKRMLRISHWIRVRSALVSSPRAEGE